MTDAIKDITEDTMDALGYIPEEMEWQVPVGFGAINDFSALQVRVLGHYVIIMHYHGGEYDWYFSYFKPDGWLDDKMKFVKTIDYQFMPRTYLGLLRQAGDLVNEELDR